MTVVRSIFNFDPSGLRAVGAILRVFGLALSAVGGEAIGGHGAAVLAGVGALYAGIASFGGIHQTRLRRMLAAIVAASLATLVGSYVQPSDTRAIATTFLVSLGLGILAAAGPDAAQVALLATGTLVVFSGLHGAAAEPLQNALLVLGGGLGQALILTAVHPFSPIAAERRAVAAVYEAMARFTRGRAKGLREPPLSDAAPLVAARDLLREAFSYDKPPELTTLWSELELADALRANVAGLDRCEVPASVWEELTRWFEAAADAIIRGRPVQRTPLVWTQEVTCAPWPGRIARTIESPGIGGMPPVAPQPKSWLAGLRKADAIREITSGHALRYAVALTIATAGYRLLKIDHGYWAPLALAFSLRTDFASTITRGLGRIVGTTFGVALATALIAVFHPGAMGLTVLMLTATYVAFTLMGASFVVYSAALSFYVVVSVVLAGASATTIGIERIWATIAGSALALIAALAWPRWEADKARTALAVAFAAQAEYADAVRQIESPETLSQARVKARAARLEAERVVGAAALEPPWSRGERLHGAQAALARLAENAARIVAAHIAVLDPHEDDQPEDLARLAAVDRSMAADLMG